PVWARCPWWLLSAASLFFFSLIRRPPRSPLFPTRRSSDLHRLARRRVLRIDGRLEHDPLLERPGSHASAFRSFQRSISAVIPSRSEEHTSELQSRENLVCRLLLEKKKKKNKLR